MLCVYDCLGLFTAKHGNTHPYKSDHISMSGVRGQLCMVACFYPSRVSWGAAARRLPKGVLITIALSYESCLNFG